MKTNPYASSKMRGEIILENDKFIVMDIKPEPKTQLELWEREKNYIKSLLISVSPRSKKIKVKQYGETCNAWGRKQDCLNPNCSWFNHAMVGMAGGDLPEGYIES